LGDLTQPIRAEQLNQIVQDIIDRGYSYTKNFLTEEERAGLCTYAFSCWESGDFRKAGIGKGSNEQLHPEIRTDRIFWIEPTDTHPLVQSYLQFIESLRLAVNRELFIGAFNYEGHFAVYPPGSFYKRHLDCFAEQPRRQITCILYLNKDWKETDGGNLRLYHDANDPDAYIDYYPEGGSLIIFLSEQYEHEVLPTERERMSLTGWLCRSDDQDFLR